MATDERKFEVGAFIARRGVSPQLLEVLHCRVVGTGFSTRRRVLSVENSMTLSESALTESQMKPYHFVQWAERWRERREATTTTITS